MNMRTNVTIITVMIFASFTSWAEEILPKVESVFSSGVRFEHVEIERLDGRYVLSGKIKRSVYNSRVAPGHIDYVVIGGSGEIVVEGAITYSPSLSLRRWRYGSLFSVMLPEAVTKEASVRVTFHKNKGVMEEYSRPVLHDSNVLISE